MGKLRRNRQEREHTLAKANELMSIGHSLATVCGMLNISEKTYYRWRNEQQPQSNSHRTIIRLLRKELAHLQKQYAELSIDCGILRIALQGKC